MQLPHTFCAALHRGRLAGRGGRGRVPGGRTAGGGGPGGGRGGGAAAGGHGAAQLPHRHRGHGGAGGHPGRHQPGGAAVVWGVVTRALSILSYIAFYL